MRCMNELQVFTNPEFGTVRTMLIADEPWAVGKDVAVALGYSNPRKALSDHVDKEDKNTVTIRDGIRGNPNMTIINESGLYSLILSSKLPNAKRFKRWVTSEVLPTIRKTGSYTARNAEPEQRVLTPDDYLTAARIISGCRNERMPYVVKLLKQAGIDVDMQPKDARPAMQDARRQDLQTAKLLTVAIKQYGVSYNAIARRTGLWSNQIARMQKGTAWYVPERAKAVRDAVHDLLPQLDIDAIYNSVT